jgi:hypothetical protein
VWTRLDAKVPRPERRTGFKHDPLGPWVDTMRGELLWAVLVLVQHWLAEDRPLFTARRLASFEAWSKIVGGILEAGGIPSFLANVDTFTARADSETRTWEHFVDAWWDALRDAPVRPATLLPIARDLLPEVVGDKGERSEATRLANALHRRLDWRFDLDGRHEFPEEGLGDRRQVQLAEAQVPDDDPPRPDGGRRTRPGWRLVPVAPEGGKGLGGLGSVIGHDLTGEEDDEKNRNVAAQTSAQTSEHRNEVWAPVSSEKDGAPRPPRPCDPPPASDGPQDPRPHECRLGHSRVWRSTDGSWRCEICHPPASESIVVERATVGKEPAP